MRCNSGKVSWLTSMTGGWYVCIMDMGRSEARESLRSRVVARDGGRSLLNVSKAVAVCAKLVGVPDCLGEGERGVGEAGPGEGPAEDGFFCSVF